MTEFHSEFSVLNSPVFNLLPCQPVWRLHCQNASSTVLSSSSAAQFNASGPEPAITSLDICVSANINLEKLKFTSQRFEFVAYYFDASCWFPLHLTDRDFLTKRVHAYRYIVIDSQVTQITGFRLLKKGFHDSDLSNTEVLIPQMIIKHRDCAVKTITNDW